MSEYHLESLESFNRHMAVDAAGVFLCYQIAARKMIELGHREGRLICAASMASKQGECNEPDPV